MRRPLKWKYLLSIAGGVGMFAALGLYHTWPSAFLFRVATQWNYLGFALSERLAPIFFDRRRIVPSSGEASFVEAVLLLSALIQCFSIGTLIDYFAGYRSRANRAQS